MKTFKKIALYAFIASCVVLIALVFIGAYFNDNNMRAELNTVNNILHKFFFLWAAISLFYIALISAKQKKPDVE